MKRRWNAFWLCCTLTVSAIMFAQAFGHIAWPPKWVGLGAAAIMFTGSYIHCRANRTPRPAR